MLIIRRSKLYYTASGIVTLCRWPSGAQFIISLLYSSTCFEHRCAHQQEVKLYYTASGIVTFCRWPSWQPEGFFYVSFLPFFAVCAVGLNVRWSLHFLTFHFFGQALVATSITPLDDSSVSNTHILLIRASFPTISVPPKIHHNFLQASYP